MKKLFTIFVIVFGILSSTSAQTPKPNSEEQAVIQLERDIANAYAQGDARTLERLFADELVNTTDFGLVTTKQEVLRSLKRLDGVTIDFTNLNARVHGNAAVVTGIAVFKVNGADADYLRFTDTFVKQQKGWQLLASQQRRVPQWVARDAGASELKTLAAVDCAQESSVRSVNSEVTTMLRFVNAARQPVVIYWVNYQGQRDPSEDQRQTLAPGETGFRYTYVSHPFLVADASGKCLGIYQPAKEPSVAIIR